MSGTGSILIVEDDALLSLSLADLLEAEGYRTKAVATVAEGLRYAGTGHIAAALIDVQLRGECSGVELAQTLSRRGVPVIICSGHSERYVRERLGPVPGTILTKPIGPLRLIDAVKDAVTARGAG